MPWYWSDDVAAVLVASGELNSATAAKISVMPTGHRSERENIEEAARELLDDGEIPLAA